MQVERAHGVDMRVDVVDAVEEPLEQLLAPESPFGDCSRLLGGGPQCRVGGHQSPSSMKAAPSAATSTSMPRPDPVGGRNNPSSVDGRPQPLDTVTQWWKSTVWARRCDGCGDREVRHRRRVDVGTAGVLDRHLHAEGHRGVADATRRRDAADARDLDRDPVDAVERGPHTVLDGGDRLVEHERASRVRPQEHALAIGGARLLQHVRARGRRGEEPPSVTHRPATIGIAVDERVGHGGDHGAQPLRVGEWLAPDLDLQSAVPLLAIPQGPVRHRIGRVVRDGSVEGGPFTVGATEEVVQRHTGGAAERVPRRHVERRLRVGMTLQRVVERARHGGQRRTEQGGRQQRRGGERTRGERRVVHGARAGSSPPSRRHRYRSPDVPRDCRNRGRCDRRKGRRAHPRTVASDGGRRPG